MGVVRAIVEQSRCKANMVAQGDGKFSPRNHKKAHRMITPISLGNYWLRNLHLRLCSRALNYCFALKEIWKTLRHGHLKSQPQKLFLPLLAARKFFLFLLFPYQDLFP